DGDDRDDDREQRDPGASNDLEPVHPTDLQRGRPRRCDSRSAPEPTSSHDLFSVPSGCFAVYYGRTLAAPESPLDQLQLRYQRVEELLTDQIRRGGRPAGSRLPPERALAEHFGVSRVTIRRALNELAHAGVVTRDGNRWAIPSTAIGEPPNQLMSFSEMAASRGLTPGGRVLDRQVRPATI